MNTITLPAWMLVLQNPLAGESPGKHIGRIVRRLIGLSLVNHADELTQLFLVNEKKPGRNKQIAGVKTNCGTSMREVFCLGGCDDIFVTKQYEDGQAVTWDLAAASDKGMLYGAQDVVWDAGDGYLFRSAAEADAFAKEHPGVIIVKRKAWQCIDEGWGLRYNTPGTNNDHMEFALGKPDPVTGICDHAGGGRTDNAITMSTGDIRFSLGRPLQNVICPRLMATAGAEDAPARVEQAQTEPESPPPAPVAPGAVSKPAPQAHRGVITAVIAWAVYQYHQYPWTLWVAVGLAVVAALLVVYAEVHRIRNRPKT